MIEGNDATVLFAAGTFLIAIGLTARGGWWKSWYFIEGIPFIAPKNSIYGSLVMGVMMVVLSILPSVIEGLARSLQRLIFLAWLGLGILGVALTVWQPRWWKPKWLRWLEKNHADAIPTLREEFRAIGLKEWRRRTAGPNGFERWVAEVRQKHDLD